MSKESMVNVCNEEGKVIARVKYNSILDYWNGSNWTSGSTGRHLGITKLKKSGQYVLIHGTQWQGEKDYAEIVGDEEAYQTIMQMNHEELLEKYPDLKRFSSEIETEEV
jgi:hypothetical protein